MPPARKTPPPGRVPTPEHRVYANTLTASGGAFDVALDFGFMAADEGPEGLVRVNMSYEHLSSAIRLLTNLLDQYTENVGEVPDPERVLADQEKEALDA